MRILVLNSGYSSLKRSLYDVGKTLPEHPPAPVWEGKIEWDGNHADIQAGNLQGAHLKDRVNVASRSDAIERLLNTLWSGKMRVLSAPSEVDARAEPFRNCAKFFSPVACLSWAEANITELAECSQPEDE